jgi:chemotaxis response regulator CheB
MALAITLALGRSPAPEQAQPASAEWAASFENAVLNQTLKKGDMEKIRVVTTERIVATGPSLPGAVAIERTVPDAPARMPPVVRVHDADDEEKPAARRRRHAERHVEANICTRHGKRKVEINGGKSWRCR